ncbi:phage tail spike protein [Paenibacillus sp. DMB5]|uniref:phage tail spike protein n=1 Tax=Paenibacillus sp. DMB5 TaxID=1780103 RepID=UPI000A48C3D6|nr:phage tail spike protein [Paenibacillus sp. DMB5]
MIKVYNQSMQLMAYLQNAFGIGYEERLNEVWSASFSLPADDDKNAECLPLRYVEIFDGEERVDLFRIMPTKTQRSYDGKTITYSCEHVLATLMDDIMFQYHQVGGAGFPISSVIQYILSKQSTPRWEFDACEFDDEFEYNYENDNLISALFAVTEPLESDYMWTWDTSTTPWTLNLVRPETQPSAWIRYGKNLEGITVDEDPTQLITRIYPLGYGEGVNQLNIVDVNPTGLPYIDADTIGEYGVIAYPYVDLSIDNAATLYAAAKSVLEQMKRPRRTYSVEGLELYRLTSDPIDKFRTGAMVRIIDEELGIDIIDRVQVRGRPDIEGAPGDVKLEIANKADSQATDTNKLASRQRISETYAQGATNIDTQNFADNCDPDHPAVLQVYVPEGTARINKLSLMYETEAFRAFSKAIAAAPATTSGPSSIETTENGGASINTNTGQQLWNIDYNYGLPEVSERTGGHNHGIAPGTQLSTPGGGYVTFVGADNHSHGLVSHQHVFDIPAHYHEMEHTHEIPEHTHEIEYGIFEGPIPSALTITVDGNTMPGGSTSGADIDIIPYLSKDANGRVQRGVWHEIKIAPDSLGRIVASVVMQLFVQSRGGGDY